MKTFISLISLIKFPCNLNFITSFRTKTDTNKHEQIHIGGRRYKCDMCPMVYIIAYQSIRVTLRPITI